jgi:hypothetical protein
LRSARLGRQVNNCADVSERLRPIGGLRNIAPEHFHVRASQQAKRSKIGDNPVNLRTQVVEEQDTVFLLDQLPGDFEPYESEAAANQYPLSFHGFFVENLQL